MDPHPPPPSLLPDAAAGTSTRSDKWGYAVRTGSDDCISSINAYYNEYLTHGRRRAVILDAIRHDSSCVLASALAAEFLSFRDPARAMEILSSAAPSLGTATPYEVAVFRIVSGLVGDGNKDEDAAIEQHLEFLKEFPKDLLTLKRAQGICFYIGRPDLSLSLVEQVLSYNQDQSFVYGMLSFPLLELGRMADAEIAARKGCQINKNDIWSQHCLCHVLQNDCHFREAVAYMNAFSPSWSACSSFMITHNWWHVAICYLEGHSPLHNVLEVYDRSIWKELERLDAEHQEVYLNALGLLLHVHVRGQMGCFEDRLEVIASFLTNKAMWHAEWLFDILALWALSCKRKDAAYDLLESIRARFFLMSKKRQHLMQRGIKLAQAMYEYGRGNFMEVYDILGPEFVAADYKVIGASDEQLDVFNDVWYNVLLNTGHSLKAIKYIESQIEKRVGVPFLWRMLERAYNMEEKTDASSVAAKKAAALESAYFPS